MKIIGGLVLSIAVVANAFPAGFAFAQQSAPAVEETVLPPDKPGLATGGVVQSAPEVGTYSPQPVAPLAGQDTVVTAPSGLEPVAEQRAEPPADASAAPLPSVSTPAPAVSALDPQGFAWSAGPVTADEAARLFRRVCLDTLPQFNGANDVLRTLGFVSIPSLLMRNHPQKNVSAMAMSGVQRDSGGTRSCAIIAEGIAAGATARALEPLVTARFSPVQRHRSPTDAAEHIVWSNAHGGREVRVMVTEADGETYLGITLLPSLGG